jgi:hypothetical protein
MKDSNDNATLDWVDEVELTENERKFLENCECSRHLRELVNPSQKPATQRGSQ